MIFQRNRSRPGMWVGTATIHKFDAAVLLEAQREGIATATLADCHKAGIDPYRITEAFGNLEVNDGLNNMLKLLIGAGGTTYANGNARLCVGDGSSGSVPTAAATDRTLAALVNRYNQAADATYPSVTAAVLTIVSTFPTGVANFAWNEWGMDRGGASGSGAVTAGDLFNHRGVALGTKTSNAQWSFTATITQS